MSRLKAKLASGEKTITAEITPPKGIGVKKLLQHAELVAPLVDAINLTDCQRALVKMSSLAASRVLIDHGFEPVLQLTCRDRNRIALQSDLMGAGALEIPNLLCLTGDPVKVGDHPDAKSVFELEAVGLMKLVGKLQAGRDDSGQKMNRASQFFIGGVVNPTQHAPTQLTRMKLKIEAGAQFFQTQANYDLDDFAAFLAEARKLPAKILGGVLVLHSYDIAAYIDANIPGIRIPPAILDRFKESRDPVQTGIDIAVETMLKIEPSCDGFHLMTVREEELIPKVLEAYRARAHAPNAALRSPSGSRS